MNVLFTSNEAKFRLLRTIIQGIIGVIIANLDMIIGFTPIPPEVKPMIVALVMACLSPIMAYLGEQNGKEAKYDEVIYDDTYAEDSDNE